MARTSVVTGANRGIGLEVARALSSAGDDVILACRDVDAAARASTDFARRPEIVRVDFSDLDDVRAFATSLGRSAVCLDRLVLNAGIWPSERVLGAGGFEQAFVVNHLAPFLLLRLLESALVRSGTRVVSVTAGLAAKGRIDLARTPSGLDFGPIHTYATTKLCHLLLVPTWAGRLGPSGASIVAVHPGVVRTGLGDRPGALGWILRSVKRGWLSPEDGATPVVELALGDESKVNGAFFLERERSAMPSVVDDAEFVGRLWEHAEAATVPRSR